MTKRRFETGYDFEKHGITYTMLADFMRCRQCCHFKLDGWEDTRVKPALYYGKLIHECLRAQEEKGGYQDVLEHWGRVAAESGGEKEMEIVEKAAIVLEAYYRYWKDPLDVVETEKYSEVAWEGVTLRGRRDAVIRVKGGLEFLFETKTSSRISEASVEEALQLDMQDMIYALMWEVETGRRLSGSVRNIIRSPGIVLKNLRADIEKRPEHYFHRYQVVFTEERMKRFKREFKKKITAFRRWTQGRESTYRNELSCHMPWRCEFVDACTTGSMNGYVQDTQKYRR